MGAFFRTDPSITARGIAPAFDPIAAMSRIANLRRLQQRGEINQQQLEDMERERERQQATRDAVGGGGTRADMLRRLQQDAPLAGLDLKERFAKQDFQAAQTRKTKLENSKATYGLIGQLAGPLDFLEQQGADIETLQVAYADSLGKLADAGIDTSKLPQEYKPGMARQAMMEAVTEKDRIDQALRAEEAAERTAARKAPKLLSPEEEAQQIRIRRAAKGGPKDRAARVQAAIRAKNNAMRELKEQFQFKPNEGVFSNVDLNIVQTISPEQMRQRRQDIQNAFEEEMKALGQDVEHIEFPSEAPGGEGPSAPAARIAKRADVERFAASRGLTFEQAAQALRQAGFRIE